MIPTVDPRQNPRFDPFDGVIPPRGRRIIAGGWLGVFRHLLLEVMPVNELGRHFSDSLGAPAKELSSMAGLVFRADGFGWTAQDAREAAIFRSDVQDALNREPGAELATRTVERDQKRFREDDRAARVCDDVTTRLITTLDRDVSRQRLDSTHVFSPMARFGRTKLRAVASQRFLTPLTRPAPDAYDALPEDIRQRSEPRQARLFAEAKHPEAHARCRQQAAAERRFISDRFADHAEHANRSTSQALSTIFDPQCELTGDSVVVTAQTGGDWVQNPSDHDAPSDAPKGPGYQVQIAATGGPENEVQLITATLPPTASAPDGPAVTPMLAQLEEAGRRPEELLADTLSTGAEPVEAAAARGVDRIGPVPGRTPESAPETLTVDDFALDERTGPLDAGPAGPRPTSCARDAETATTRLERPASAGVGCPFQKPCPIKRTRDGAFVLEFTDQERRLAAWRMGEATAVFRERSAPRSGIESTHSGLKNRLQWGSLSVRGLGSVSRVLLHKLAGWNVLRASASKKLKAWVASRVAETLGTGDRGRSEGHFRRLGRLGGRGARVFWRVVRPDQRSELRLAA